MAVHSLVYMGMAARDPAAWSAFAAQLLGAVEAEDGGEGERRIRLDDAPFRIAVEQQDEDGSLLYLGFECGDEAALLETRRRLEAIGARVEPAPEALRVRRGAESLLITQDPDGNRIELGFGFAQQVNSYRPELPHIGECRLGHAVLRSAHWRDSQRFYREGLGFGLSDYIAFEHSNRQLSVVFMHCGDLRHHTVALIDGGVGISHLMIEVPDLDAVGVALDRCRAAGYRLRMELGRHTNDRMTSFYAYSPNGVPVEIGCGGILVDRHQWVVRRYDRPSLWGHTSGGH